MGGQDRGGQDRAGGQHGAGPGVTPKPEGTDAPLCVDAALLAVDTVRATLGNGKRTAERRVSAALVLLPGGEPPRTRPGRPRRGGQGLWMSPARLKSLPRPVILQGSSNTLSPLKSVTW